MCDVNILVIFLDANFSYPEHLKIFHDRLRYSLRTCDILRYILTYHENFYILKFRWCNDGIDIGFFLVEK